MTAQTKPFTERFQEMLGEALLRTGMIEGRHYYTRQPNMDAYAKFGFRRYARKEHHSFEELYRPPSLSDAKCPTCKAKVKVVDVEERTSHRFAGTFADDESFQHAVGRLVCSKHSDHTAKLGSDMTTVSLDSTIAEIIPLLDEIADELGY